MGVNGSVCVVESVFSRFGCRVLTVWRVCRDRVCGGCWIDREDRYFVYFWD